MISTAYKVCMALELGRNGVNSYICCYPDPLYSSEMKALTFEGHLVSKAIGSIRCASLASAPHLG